MTDLVSELQAKALDQKTSVTELLRLAKVVAVKLDLGEFLTWIELELTGYEGVDVPSYRVLIGEMKARSRFHGLIPVNFPDDKLALTAKTVRLHQKISELEILAQSTDGQLHMPFTDEMHRLLQEIFKQDVPFMLIFSPVALSGITDAVRNVILDWSLKLEKNGIKGEGMSFSKEDKAKAHAPGVIYQINKIDNFTGNMGTISDHGVVNATTNIGFNADEMVILVEKIEKSRKELGLAKDKQLELEKTLSDLKLELKNQSPKPAKLGALLGLARTIIQTAGSSLLVQGALFEIDKFKHLFT